MFARLGRAFARLGLFASGTPIETPPGEDAPPLQFNDAANSQLLALLEDF